MDGDSLKNELKKTQKNKAGNMIQKSVGMPVA